MNRTRNVSPILAPERWSPHRTIRLRIGVVLMVAAVAASVFVAPLGIARAEEGSGDATPLEVTKQAYWTRSLGNVAPGSLTKNFPPSVACLVWPDSAPVHVCGGPLEHGQGLDSVVGGAQPGDKIPGGDALGEFMAGGKDTLPTGVIAGARRYLSGLEFKLPKVAESERVSKFELRLTAVDEDRLNFHFDSPAFRQAVVAAIVAVGNRDAEKFREEAEKIPERSPRSETPLGVEACPILIDWKAGGNQDGATAPERDAIERTPEGKVLEPEVNCVLGANGVLKDGKWVFDLTLAANAWAEGRLENRGVLLRPVLPPNLAYGDPDLSTWDQVTVHSPLSTDVAGELPSAVFATKEKAKPLLIGGGRTETQVLGAQTETFTETFGSMDTPEIADRPTPAVAAPRVEQAAPALLSGDPVTKWWVWLLLPMFLGGIYLTTQALATEPVLAGAGERSGAMTRLIEARRRGELT